MTQTAPKQEAQRPAEDCSVAWFVVLEKAREVNDFKRAAEAQEQLLRLGVRVSYLRPRRREAAHVA